MLTCIASKCPAGTGVVGGRRRICLYVRWCRRCANRHRILTRRLRADPYQVNADIASVGLPRGQYLLGQTQVSEHPIGLRSFRDVVVEPIRDTHSWSAFSLARITSLLLSSYSTNSHEYSRSSWSFRPRYNSNSYRRSEGGEDQC